MTMAPKTDSNVHFVPSNPKSVKRCKLYDMNTCNQTGYWETYDETIHNVCHNEQDLPIISIVDYKAMLFKNRACLHCNSPTEISDNQLRCMFSERTGPPLLKTLAVNFHIITEYQKLDTFDVTYIKNSVPQNIDFGSCTPGLAVVLGRCRKLHCPRDHYNVMGRCVPLYTRITGLGVNFRIKVSPLQDIQGVKIRQVATTLLSVVNTTLEKCISLQERDITVWYLAKNKEKVVRYYLFDIKVDDAKREFVFNQAVQEVYHFYDEIRTIDTLRLSTGSKFGFQYAIAHGIETNIRNMADPSYPEDGMFRLLISDKQKLQETNNYITLTDINWCVRIEFSSSEVEVLGKYVWRVKMTGTVLFRDQFDIELHSDVTNFSLYTCINYFIDASVGDTITQDFLGIIKTESEDTTIDGQTILLTFDRGLVTFSAVFVIIVVCIVAYRIRSYLRARRLRSNEDPDQEATNSFSEFSKEKAVPMTAIKPNSTKGKIVSTEHCENNKLEMCL